MSKQKYYPTEGTSTKCRNFSGPPRRGERYPADAVHDFFDSAIYPLSLWRTLRAAQFEAADLTAIRVLLAKLALLGRSKWRDAVAGDAPAAIAVALSFLPIDNVTRQVDVAMTALVRCAIEGDLAAAIVIANILRNLPGSTPLHRQIATSWFVSNLAMASARTRKFRSESLPGSPHLPIATDDARRLARRNHISRALQFLKDQGSES